MEHLKSFNENVNDNIKKEILDYLNENYPEDWWNDQFDNMVDNYVSEEDIIGNGDEDDPEFESAYDCYISFCNGGAIEYDILDIIAKDIMEKFNIDSNTYYENDYGDIVKDYMKDTISWYDAFIF